MTAPMEFLTPRYNLGLVAASVLIGTLSAYVMLDVARRRHGTDRGAARTLLAVASLAMGTGIWSMHFVGMLAYSLPIALGYARATTAASWLASVMACSVALRVAAGPPSLPRIAAGALAMGAGISAMHYVGMAALEMTPAIVWDRSLVAASVAIAIGASAAALLVFYWLRERAGGVRSRQLLAAIAMGLATSGMHYSGMAAARFPAGSVCLSVDGVEGSDLGALALLASVTMLSLTLLLTALGARMQRRAQRFAATLRAANARLREANRALRRTTRVDALTGLPNRQQFEEGLHRAAASTSPLEGDPASRGAQPRLAVMAINLDRLRVVNDVVGHGGGDLVLKEVAARLSAAVRRRDMIARVGGDSFLLLMHEDVHRDTCEALARRLLDALQRPFDVAGRQVAITGSIGIALYPDHGARDDLVVRADAALYAAKRMGGGTCAVFAPEMLGDALEDMELHVDLRQAIERGELSLHYQPKIDGRRGQIRGVEALLRWHHPQRGWVSPARFIPIAERFGLMVPIGNWVVDEACRQMQAWADAGLRLHVAINVSAQQLRRNDLAARIEQAIDRHQVDASLLLCEITESVAMDDVKATQSAFEGLERIGVYLSIDDFGTGYSSLAYLRQLPARQLKIDRSFVGDIESSADARAIVDAVIRLAHALSLSVVAEGVETAAQRDVLLALGCDELQGYFFARPMPADALLAWANGRERGGEVDFSPSIVDEALAA